MGYLVVPSASNNDLTNAVFFPSANTGSTLTGLMNGTSYNLYATTAGPVVTPQSAVQLIANTVPNPSMSISLGIIREIGPRPFINQFKLATPWTGSVTGGGQRSWDQLRSAGNINDRGQVISIPSGLDNIVCYPLQNMVSTVGGTGRWRLTWEGTGNVLVLNAQNTVNTSTNRIDFDYTANGSNSVAVLVTSVTSGPMRNFKLVHHSDIADDTAGRFFRTEWFEQVRNYRTIRFDNWHGINDANIVNWSDRPHPDDVTYLRKFVPLEVMADLCNLAGSDGWFCIHHMAGNDYVTQAATLLRDRLAPNRHCYIEYSNKCWDFATPQAGWCRDRGNELFGDTDQTNFMQYYGGRSAEVAQLARAAWGPTPRLHTVIQSQCDWLGLEEYVLNAPKWRALGTGRNAPHTYCTDYTVHAQIDGGMAYGENGSVVDGWRTSLTQTEAFNRIRDQQLDGRHINVGDARTVSNLTPKWQYHRNIATARNMRFITYDGGSHLHFGGATRNIAAFRTFIHAYHYSTQFRTVLEATVNAFLGVGADMFSFSVDNRIPDENSTTGLQRWPTDFNPVWEYYTTRNSTVPGPTDRGPFDFVGTYEGTVPATPTNPDPVSPTTPTTPTTEWQNIVPVGSGPTGNVGTITVVNGDYRVTTVSPNTNGRAKINLPAAGTVIDLEISMQWNDVTRLVCRQVSGDWDTSVDTTVFDINRSPGDSSVLDRIESFTVQPGKTMLHFIAVSTAGQYFTINSSSRVRIAQSNATSNLSVVNFTIQGYTASQGITSNNVTDAQITSNSTLTYIPNITNVNGVPTGVSLTASFTGNPANSSSAPGRGVNTEGVTSGLPTYTNQLLSSNLVSSTWYMTQGVTFVINLTNLVPNKNYRLGFVSSRSATDARYTTITANGIYYTQNTSVSPAVENNLVIPANAQGHINIVVEAQAGTNYSYINGFSFRDALSNETVSTNPAASTAPAQFSTTGWSVATGSSPAQVTMNITTLPSNGGSAITALQYSINNGTSWTNLSGTGTGSRTLTMAANGTSYTFLVRAVNAIGNGTASASKTATSGAASTTTPTTPVSNIRTFTYQNSLFDHQANGGADDDTRVPNWAQRMASSAGLTYQATGYFGFANQWPLPPRADVGYENVTVPSGVQQWTSTWSGYSNINMLTFVPDNFDSFDRAPNVNSTNSASPIGANQNYRDRLLQIIDAWETNAPMPNSEKRKYRVYSGWADFNRSGGQWNTYTTTQLNTYLTYSYGQYQTWYVDLVNMLKTARPNLDIELIDLQRVVMLTWRNTPLNTLTGSRMWEDQAPHGTETWYLLAAMVYYMEIYGAKPPANFNPLAGTGAGSGVDAVMINNWSTIVDYAWNALGN